MPNDRVRPPTTSVRHRGLAFRISMEAPVTLRFFLLTNESLRRDECTFVHRFVAFPFAVVTACRSIHPSSAQAALKRCGPEIDRQQRQVRWMSLNVA